jgi:import receptor subunit TOM22
MSREESPDRSRVVSEGRATEAESFDSGPVALPSRENTMQERDDEEEEEEDESLSERLWGLTEMFPEKLRRGVGHLTFGSINGAHWLYGFSRSATWIFFSSSAILIAPILFEIERSNMEEMQKSQQRQMLLGPGAAMSGGSGMSMPR